MAKGPNKAARTRQSTAHALEGSSVWSCLIAILLATIRYHFQTNYPDLLPEIHEDTYADNVAVDARTDTEALEKCEQLKKSFNDMNMKLHEFLSNSKAVMQKFADDKDATEARFLGLKWNLIKDSMKISYPDKAVGSLTKRGVLQTISKLFDPLGLVSPTTVWPKLLIQDLWVK